jgi:hypothetical protein
MKMGIRQAFVKIIEISDEFKEMNNYMLEIKRTAIQGLMTTPKDER